MMNTGQKFFQRAHTAGARFQSFNRLSQAAYMNQFMTLKAAQSTLYQNQLRFQSSLLVPLNTRLMLENAAEMDEEMSLVAENDDLEDDTLQVPNILN